MDAAVLKPSGEDPREHGEVAGNQKPDRLKLLKGAAVSSAAAICSNMYLLLPVDVKTGSSASMRKGWNLLLLHLVWKAILVA